MSPSQRQTYLRAYGWHLRGWLPRPAPDAQWYDLGCGQGALLQIANSAGYQACGVDLSDEMVEQARNVGVKATKGEAVEYVRGLAAESADVISAFDLIEHLTWDEGYELLTAVCLALKPGGICLLKLPNLDSPWGPAITASDLTHQSTYTPESLQHIAGLAGFTNSQVRELEPGVHSGRAVVRLLAWRVLRCAFALTNVIETGSVGSGVYTRVMFARLVK